MNKIRSFLFNICFYGWTTFICLVLVFCLLVPRKWANNMVKYGWSYPIKFFEKYVLGLTYEIKGLENLPKDQLYIVAAKHQSAWETVKLHILFEDPVIILKKELQYIPFFGWYTWKTGMIAVKRNKRGQAIPSMIEGAQRVKKEGRSLVIFPQGTRTPVGAKRPYKRGLSILYKELDLPIIPMALNSGVFWPKNSYKKKPGHITIEFLPAIPAGLEAKEAMTQLEEQLEAASDRLCIEAGGPALGATDTETNDVKPTPATEPKSSDA